MRTGPVVRIWWTWALFLAAMGALMVLQHLAGRAADNRFLFLQDLPFAVAILLAIPVIGRTAPADGFTAPAALLRPRVLIPALMLLVLAAGAAGRFLVFENYLFSRDEHLALFDAQIFASGQLLGEIPAQWRDKAKALEPMFMFDVPGGRYWISNYLPINAALRALPLKAGLEFLVSPLLAALAILATYGVGRRLWPDQPRKALVAAVLLGTSSQLIVTAMTPYAMTAHLAFNMAWLWLFLRDTPRSDAAALAVGWGASGLHQIVFHPLFAAPFVLQLWLDRRWRRAAVYTAGYAAIGLFWILYRSLIFRAYGIEAEAAQAGGVADGFVVHALKLLSQFDPAQIGVMARNLLRLATWQNLIVIPLFLAATLPALRQGGTLRALVLGFWLTVLFCWLVLPMQVHGWGYRYVHGFLGGLCLLAAEAWDALLERAPAERRPALWATMSAAAALSLALSLPLHALQVREIVRPFQSAEQHVRSRDVDLVLVDAAPISEGFSLIRNRPDLSNRPLILDAGALEERELRRLCSEFRIGRFGLSEGLIIGLVEVPKAFRNYPDTGAKLDRSACVDRQSVDER